MKELKYSIGDYVMVYKTMMRDKQDNEVTWRKALGYISTTPRLAQVVGLCTRFDGYKQYLAFADQTILFITKSHRFWLVRFGLINRAVEVAEEDMRLVFTEEIHDLPYRWPSSRMDERSKQCLSEDSKHWPRDSKGRWMKGPCTHERT